MFWLKSFRSAPLSRKDFLALRDLSDKELGLRFWNKLTFGTGGMRALTGLGSNRLNVQNIALVTKAMIGAISEARSKAGEAGEISLVIAFDSRLTSEGFSRVAYWVARNLGATVKIFRRPTPTPLLSFAIRSLGFDLGVVITASHNPPAYNGFKIYGKDGGQIVQPLDKEIEDLYLKLNYADLSFFDDFSNYIEKPPLEADQIEQEIVKDYLAMLEKTPFSSKPSSSPQKAKLPILYTPLHGTGGWLMEQTLKHFGFDSFRLLPSQSQPDGNFPTVKSPNPEEKEVFTQAIKNAQDARLILASDPDADRLGVVLQNEDQQFQYLSGNQIGALLLEFLASLRKVKPKDFACKTIVTSQLQERIAATHNLEMKNTLTGFKYIAAEIAKNPDHYIFGGEESYGYLPISTVRDKDSISTALALAELASQKDLSQFLEELYCKHGVYFEKLHIIQFSPENTSSIAKIMKKIMVKLENPNFTQIGSRKIIDILNLQNPLSTPKTPKIQKLKKSLPQAPTELIQYFLSPEGKLTIRPSGTEPKIKIYLSLRHLELPGEKSVQEILQNLESEAEQIITEFTHFLEIN